MALQIWVKSALPWLNSCRVQKLHIAQAVQTSFLYPQLGVHLLSIVVEGRGWWGSFFTAGRLSTGGTTNLLDELAGLSTLFEIGDLPGSTGK